MQGPIMFQRLGLIVLGLFINKMRPVSEVNPTQIFLQIVTDPNDITILGILKKSLIPDLAYNLVRQLSVIFLCSDVLTLAIWTFGGSWVRSEGFLWVDLGFERLLLAVDLFVERFVVGDWVANIFDLVILEFLDDFVQ